MQPTYVIRGTARGMLEPVALHLTAGGRSETVRIAADGPFALALPLIDGTEYAVSLPDAPPCVLIDATGVVRGADPEVTLACEGVVALSELGLSGPTAPALAFTPEKLTYQAKVSLLQQSTQITAVAVDAEAAITIAEQPAQSGVPSTPLPLALGNNDIDVVVTHPLGPRRTYRLTVSRAAAIAQFVYGKATSSDAGDWLGYSVALSGDTLVVGAPCDDSASTGTGGDSSNNSAPDSGAVYVFRRRGATWAQEAYIKPSNTGAGDRFGSSVAIDGDLVAVGARHEDSSSTGVGGVQTNNGAGDSGAVYVFRRTGAFWLQEAYLKASNTSAGDQFGHSVALSGTTLVVGARYEDSSALGVNGASSDEGAEDSGAAYVFRRAGAGWVQEAYLKASNTDKGDYFGESVAVSGNLLAVGAYAESSGARGVDGDQTREDAPESGAVYVFRRQGNEWAQEAYIKASNTDPGDRFGHRVALDGDLLAVGAYGESSASTGMSGDQDDNSAPDSGAVYVFHHSDQGWAQEAYIKAENAELGDWFGQVVALAGDTLAVGAVFEGGGAKGVDGNSHQNGAPYSGAVYVFRRAGGTWARLSYIKASNADSNDQFGWSLALSGDTLATGALYESSRSSGIGGDQADNSALGSGAVYIFH